MKLSAYCLTCKQSCSLTRAHVHRAGSPCVHHSSFGDRRQDSGESHFLFWVWCAIMRMLLNPIIIHENVPGFGLSDLRRTLGDLYWIIRVPMTPTELGWPTARDRQLVLLVLKSWLSP
eukprot:8339175-Pyramimonas_sp.AAC.1